MRSSVLLLVLALLVATGCERVRRGHGHSPLEKKLRNQQIDRVALNKVADRVLNPPDLSKTVRVEFESPKRTVYVLKREHELKRFPCKSCHSKPIPKRSEYNVMVTHGDISLSHAKKGVLECKSCHNAPLYDSLKLQDGRFVGFNRSFELCASCHSKQAKDWVGGAHGKRDKYWMGPRVVRNCTGCHSPHKPAFGKRWPKTYYHRVKR